MGRRGSRASGEGAEGGFLSRLGSVHERCGGDRALRGPGNRVRDALLPGPGGPEQDRFRGSVYDGGGQHYGTAGGEDTL